MEILIETSARHVHLCETDCIKLFGKGYKLTKRKNLLQPGQFAAEERISIVGTKSEIKNVSVLGPLRTHTQVEISLTDARKLGLEPPIRESGKLEGTPGCKLVGPAGEITLKEGVIVAKRHIHLDLLTSQKRNLIDGAIVKVEVNTPGRALIFGDVVVRVSEMFLPAMHIDTDEANAAGIFETVYGKVIC